MALANQNYQNCSHKNSLLSSMFRRDGNCIVNGDTLERFFVDAFNLELTDESCIIAELIDDIDQFISHVVAWSTAQIEVGTAISAVGSITEKWADSAEENGARLLMDTGKVFSEQKQSIERVRESVIDQAHKFADILHTVKVDVECQSRVLRDVLDKCVAKLKKHTVLKNTAVRGDLLRKLTEKDSLLAWAIVELEMLTQAMRNAVYSCKEQRRDLLRNSMCMLSDFGLETICTWSRASPSIIGALGEWSGMPDFTSQRRNLDLMDKDNLTISTLLYNSTAYQYYYEFLSAEMASENGDFIHAVQQFEDQFDEYSAEEQQQYSNNIIDEYIRNGAPKEINIDGTTRSVILSNGDKLTKHLFISAKQAVIELLRWDSLPKFKESEHYQSLQWRINELSTDMSADLIKVAFRVSGHKLLRVGGGLCSSKAKVSQSVGLRRSFSQ